MNNPLVADLESLIAKIKQGFQPEYLFFYGHQPRKDGAVGKQCFSQWWPSSFEVQGIRYPTAEHFMMAGKARLFGDMETYRQILAAAQPEQAKKLGRSVKGFDEETWIRNRLDLVIQANEAKFRQNEALGEFLLETGGKILVEASPYDRVWGIGLAEDDARAAHPEQWKGLNLLGFALMAVRQKLGE